MLATKMEKFKKSDHDLIMINHIVLEITKNSPYLLSFYIF